MGPLTILAIHDFLHTHRAGEILKFLVNGKAHKLEIQKTAIGLKYMDYEGITFIEQNQSKNSIYAEMAKKGHKVTWGISRGPWIKIIDRTVYSNGKVFRK